MPLLLTRIPQMASRCLAKIRMHRKAEARSWNAFSHAVQATTDAELKFWLRQERRLMRLAAGENPWREGSSDAWGR